MKNPSTRTTTARLPLALLLVATLGLTACGGSRPELSRDEAPRATLTAIPQDEMAFELQRQKDAEITAGVDAQLQRDGALNPVAIDVDTSKGRVILRGLAPDTDARERATLLAKQVEGVRSVDNLLHVRS